MAKLPFDENKRNIISKSLKLARVKNNITQGELASRMQTQGVNIDQQMISKIERNQRIVTDYELACFCLALETSAEKLFEDFYEEYKDQLYRKPLDEK